MIIAPVQSRDGLPQMGTAAAPRAEALAPRMISPRARPPHPWRRGRTRRRHGRRGRARRRMARHEFPPRHEAIAIPNRERAIARLTHVHGAPRRHADAGPLQLQQTIVVADHPIVGERARLLQSQLVLQEQRMGRAIAHAMSQWSTNCWLRSSSARHQKASC
jgi:hypothetical protein